MSENKPDLMAELAEVVRLSERATPGPWLFRPKSNSWHKPPPEGTTYSYGEYIMGAGDDDENGNGYDEQFMVAVMHLVSTPGFLSAIEAAVRDAGKCWALHFRGPDDVVAAPSREAAEIAARNFNAFWDAHKDKRGHDVRVVAEVIEWEHGCVEHAKSAAQHWPEYADLLETRAMHNSAREG